MATRLLPYGAALLRRTVRRPSPSTPGPRRPWPREAWSRHAWVRRPAWATRRRLRALAAVLALAEVATAGTAYAISRDGTGAADAAVTVDRGPVVVRLSTTGTVAPTHTRTLAFTAAGTVTAVRVRVGEVVRAGQSLATVDTTALAGRVALARTALAQAETALAQAETAPAEAPAGTVTPALRLLAWTGAAPASTVGPTAATPPPGPTATAGPTRTATPRPTRTAPPPPRPPCRCTTPPTRTAVPPRDPWDGRTGPGRQNGNEERGGSGGQAGGSNRQDGDNGRTGAGQNGGQGDGGQNSGGQRDGGQSGGGRNGGDAILAAAQRVIQARRQLADLTAQLAGATISAPIAGRVLSVAGAVGTAVRAGSTFLTLSDISRLQVATTFPEADAGRLAVGQSARITVPGLPAPVAGRVTQVDPVGTTGGAVVTYGAVVSFTEVPAGLLLGQSAQVLVTAAAVRDAVRVPVTALHDVAGGTGTVRILTGGRGAPRAVGIGLRGDQYAAVTSGLATGERIAATW